MAASSRPVSRRSILRSGLGLAGLGLAAGSGLLATAPPARAQQVGTSLCDEPGDSASVQGLGSGDLGIPYYRPHDNSWGYVFGDSWTGIQQTGTYLGSPVMVTQAGFDASGATPITFSGALPSARHTAQLFNYQHGANNGYGTEITRIPNDCIEFGGRTYLQYTSVNNWDTTGDGSLMAGIAYSDDYGVTWQDYPYHWDGSARGVDQSLYMMWSFAGIDPDGWLYIFSKRWNGSHRNGGDAGAIQLFRIQPNDFRAGNFGAQQNWVYDGSWHWTSSGTPPSIILQGNGIGEFSVKRIGSTYCMAYFDVADYSIQTRTSPRPDQVWTAPKRQITGNPVGDLPTRPFLYGGYIHPGSTSATSLTVIVSQWNGQLNQPPYWALQYDGINP
jgi:hypothetical protein